MHFYVVALLGAECMHDDVALLGVECMRDDVTLLGVVYYLMSVA